MPIAQLRVIAAVAVASGLSAACAVFVEAKLGLFNLR